MKVKTLKTLIATLFISLTIILMLLDSKKEETIFSEDFESGTINARCSGNCPKIETDIVNTGLYSMKVYLNKNKSLVNYRTEIQEPDKAELGVSYSYEFNTYLPSSYISDGIWEIVAQWHAMPDFELGENWRNPVMALWTTNGQWQLSNIWDSKKNTFESGTREYDGMEEWFFGDYNTEEWVNWKFHVIWSYKQDGIIEVWKNDVLLLSKKGPNCYNDNKGPYFKIGLYKGWKDRVEPFSITERILYFDDIKVVKNQAKRN